MKDNFTRIAIILDRSGSMETVREATISGFNEFIRKQREVPGEATVKLVQFDDQFEEVFDKPLKDVPELTASTFVPRGWTALLDAQGRTIIGLGAELAKLPESERPSKVIVMTLTDGMENRSQEFAPFPPNMDPEERRKHPEKDGVKRIADMIKHQKEVYGWEFIFLGANQDAVKVAASINIAPQAAMTYAANPAAMGNVMRSVSNYVGSVRARGFAAFDDEDRLKAMVEDDDDKKPVSKTVVVP